MRSTQLVALVLVATACQSNGGPPPRVAVIDPEDPCRLLSRQQVEDALEVEVTAERLGESRPGPEGVVPLCLYEVESPFSTVTL
ncbi:MAG TPA: hypothetical protein VG408_08485, partial [Actinomycetota bacterium]|nr:hypothetical protein [Actinomycetota bacterium]